MDIMLTTYGIYTLVNVVIVDLIHVDIVSQATSSRGVVATIATQVKVVSYHNQHPMDDFIPLAIEMF
jgi:hypothetical protein